MISALTALLVLDLAGTLTVADRTEVRLRDVPGTPVAFDAVTTPNAGFEVHDRRVRLSLSYFPSITAADLETGFNPQIFQTIGSGVTWQATRHFSLSLGEDGSYGTQNFSYLSATPQPTVPASAQPAALQLLPGAQDLRYGSSRTTVVAYGQAARHLTLSLAGSYFIGGGLDAAARQIIPMQSTPRGEAQADVAISRRDDLVTAVSVTSSRFTARPCDPATGNLPTSTSPAGATCKPSDELVDGMETWRHRLSRIDDLALGAGASWTHAHLEPGGERKRLFPTGAVTVIHRWEGGSESATNELSIDVRLAPIIDVRFGNIDQRVQGRVANKWKNERYTTTVGFGATQSVPAGDSGAVRFLGGDVELLYAVDKRLDVGGGYRAAWQKQEPFPPFFSNVVYAVLVYHEPAIRLWP